MLVGNFFRSDDFFGFIGDLELFFLFDFLFFGLVGYDFLFGGRDDLLFFGLGEYALHHENEKNEDHCEASEYDDNRFVVARNGAPAEGIGTEFFVFAFKDNVAPFL